MAFPKGHCETLIFSVDSHVLYSVSLPAFTLIFPPASPIFLHTFSLSIKLERFTIHKKAKGTLGRTETQGKN